MSTAARSVESRRRRLWASVAAACAVVIGLNAIYLTLTRQMLEREALERVELHARMLDGHTTRALHGIAGTLRVAADAVGQAGHAMGTQASQRLTQQIAGQPLLRSLSILDETGRVLASSTPANVGANVPPEAVGCDDDDPREERIVRARRARDLGDLATPAAGRPAVIVLPLRRFAQTHSGQRVCLVALLNPDNIANASAVPGDGTIETAMLGFDGQILSATPGIGIDPGGDVADLTALTQYLPRQEFGRYAGRGIDGAPVLTAFRASRAWPVLTVVELSPSVVDEHWLRDAVWPASLGLGVVLLIVAAGIAGQFTLRREAKATALADSLARGIAESEARFRAMFEQAGVGMLERSLDGQLLRVNPALCALLGYTQKELLALPPADVLLPGTGDDDPPARADDGRLAPSVSEVRVRRKDGRQLWVRMTTSLVTGEGGQAHGAISVVEDISARRQAQMELVDARSHELDIGSRIQRSLLVPPTDRQLPGVSLSAFSLASQGIDGDFVEVMPFGEDCVDIIAGDVMGKGLSAALMGAAVKMAISRCIAQLLTDPARGNRLPEPAEIVAALHAATSANLQSLDAFVTLCYVRIDARADRLTWVGCGHEEPMVVDAAGGCVPLPNQHPPVGVLATVAYQQDAMPFGPDDALLMFSDGIVDALRADGERVGRARLGEALERRVRGHDTPAAIVHALRRDLLGEGVRFTDDVTMLLALRTASRAPAMRLEVPASMQAISAVLEATTAWSRRSGMDEYRASLFPVACIEAFTNIVRHARGGIDGAPVELVARQRGEVLEVDFIYLGEPFEPPRRIDTPSLDDYPQGGFGLTIMHKATERIDYLHASGVNTVRLTQRARMRAA